MVTQLVQAILNEFTVVDFLSHLVIMGANMYKGYFWINLLKDFFLSLFFFFYFHLAPSLMSRFTAELQVLD